MINILLEDKNSGIDISTTDLTVKKEVKNEAHRRVMAFLFIKNANRRLYSETLKTLKNDYLMGQDNYPRDMNTSQKLLANYNIMEKTSGTTRYEIKFSSNVRPRPQKKKYIITCF